MLHEKFSKREMQRQTYTTARSQKVYYRIPAPKHIIDEGGTFIWYKKYGYTINHTFTYKKKAIFIRTKKLTALFNQIMYTIKDLFLNTTILFYTLTLQYYIIFNPFPNKPWFLSLKCMSFENTMGKKDFACWEQFLLFQQLFLPVWRTFSQFVVC